ncbi:scavenger receptor cysteine-rich type 1 protein M130-like isoform X2 [Acanthaster planci]|uniref:Scavenger receptor cysteine-rich type 1 protein M130-like isoform X2 n=1 Tax=Acanthaster planci TaxID=133434 RepID=A0A8B7Y317_ACAPL|nr:scavenger receptor cysteine-rich type 1 protein M130-like isoform X2 [Acanthaster planci]
MTAPPYILTALAVIVLIVPCVSGPLGMESGAIEDSRITASSFYDSRFPPRIARLNAGNEGWIPSAPADQWIQIDLSRHVAVTGVVIQGDGRGLNRYVTAFTVQYSASGDSDWHGVLDADGDIRFGVSTGQSTNVTFPVVLMARYLRLLPQAWTTSVYRVRLEVLGCRVSDGTIMLIGGDDALSDRVEIYHEATLSWGAVCSNGWDLTDAHIACRQHHPFLEAVQAGASSAETDLPIVMNQVACKGTENRLVDCPFICTEYQQCNSSHVATVVCRPKMNTVRLVGGSNNSSGRVEVYRNNTWGSICDNDWDINDAAVVCRMLGFPGAEAAKAGAYFGQGSGPVHMDGVACTGSEGNFGDCPSSCWKEPQCSHSQDACVICQSG